MLTLATRSSALLRPAPRAAATTSAGAQKRVLVPIADGSEEIETSLHHGHSGARGRRGHGRVRRGDDDVYDEPKACKLRRRASSVDLGNDARDLVALPGGRPARRDCATATRDAIRGSRTRGERLWRRSARPRAVILKSGLIEQRRQATCYACTALRGAPGDAVSARAACATATLQHLGGLHVPQIRLHLVGERVRPEKARGAAGARAC